MQEWWSSEPRRVLVLAGQGQMPVQMDGGAMLGWAWAGLGMAGWDTTVALVPVQVCPCSCTELCAETSRIPCPRVP